MKKLSLEKITDIRGGQVYKQATGELYTVDDISQYSLYVQNRVIELRKKELQNCELVGLIGITHKIQDGKLVDIPRAEFEVGDIVKIKNANEETLGILVPDGVIMFSAGYVYMSNTTDDFIKIGTLGVDYELKLINTDD